LLGKRILFESKNEISNLNLNKEEMKDSDSDSENNSSTDINKNINNKDVMKIKRKLNNRGRRKCT